MAMRIIQSFWSKPSFLKSIRDSENRSLGGWGNKKFFYMSWALSSLQLRKFYAEVELYTDTLGKELLIDKLKLPYTKVYTSLDSINNLNTNMWALGKIFCYSIQEKPFIHVDGDVFIWNKFASRIIEADLIAQNIEKNEKYYRDVFNEMNSNLVLPSQVLKETTSKNSILVSNTGIVGGNNIDFVKKYTLMVFEIVKSNKKKINQINNQGALGITLEQFLYHFLAGLNNIKIEYFFTKEIDYMQDNTLIDFHLVPSKISFIHPLAAYKKAATVSNGVDLMLRNLHPDYYYRIQKLIGNHLI